MTPFIASSDTSEAAAKSVATTGPTLRETVLAFVSLQAGHGATCDDVERCLGMRHQTASARVRELAKAGAIVDSGKRRPTRSGRKAAVYVVKVPT